MAGFDPANPVDYSENVDCRDKLIAKQQLEIEHLKLRLKFAEEGRKKVHNILFCIGGPLNDNIKGYSKDQLGPFGDIANALGLF
jgi:hypothetical protein